MKIRFDDFERPAQVEEGMALVLREDVHFSSLMEAPNSDGEGGDSVSTRSAPSFADGDTEIYLMDLTSPGLQTPRVSVVHPQTIPPVCSVATSSNSSTKTLVSRKLDAKSPALETSEECPQQKDGGMKLGSDENEEAAGRWWLRPDGSIHTEPYQIAEGIFAV